MSWLGNDVAEADAWREAFFARGLNAWWREELRTTLAVESHLEIEFETHYLHFDADLARQRGGWKNATPVWFATVTRGISWCSWVSRRPAIGHRWRVASSENSPTGLCWAAVDTYCQGVVTALYNGDCDDQLVYRKRLRRQVDEYQKNVPPHVQAARQLDRPGRWIEYRMTVDGPEPVQLARAAVDYDHYRERQLAPAADGILHFLGTSLADICDDQMRLF